MALARKSVPEALLQRNNCPVNESWMEERE
jgi:hypothetical protein